MPDVDSCCTCSLIKIWPAYTHQNMHSGSASKYDISLQMLHCYHMNSVFASSCSVWIVSWPEFWSDGAVFGKGRMGWSCPHPVECWPRPHSVSLSLSSTHTNIHFDAGNASVYALAVLNHRHCMICVTVLSEMCRPYIYHISMYAGHSTLRRKYVVRTSAADCGQ